MNNKLKALGVVAALSMPSGADALITDAGWHTPPSDKFADYPEITQDIRNSVEAALLDGLLQNIDAICEVDTDNIDGMSDEDITKLSTCIDTYTDKAISDYTFRRIMETTTSYARTCDIRDVKRPYGPRIQSALYYSLQIDERDVAYPFTSGTTSKPFHGVDGLVCETDDIEALTSTEDTFELPKYESPLTHKARSIDELEEQMARVKEAKENHDAAYARTLLDNDNARVANNGILIAMDNRWKRESDKIKTAACFDDIAENGIPYAVNKVVSGWVPLKVASNN